MKHKAYGIETLKHQAKGETRIWSSISLVSLLLPKKIDDTAPQNQVEMIFVQTNNNMFSHGFPDTCVSFHQEAVPTNLLQKSKNVTNLWPQASGGRSVKKSPMNVHPRCKRFATFLYKPYGKKVLMAGDEKNSGGGHYLRFPTYLCFFSWIHRLFLWLIWFC